MHYNDSLHKNKILNNEWNKYLFRTYLTPIKKSDTYTYYTIVLMSFTLCFTNRSLSHALLKKKKKHMIYNSWWIFGTLLVKHKIPIPYRDLTQLRERERDQFLLVTLIQKILMLRGFFMLLLDAFGGRK